MLFTKEEIHQRLDSLLEDLIGDIEPTIHLGEIAMKRVVRKGKIVRKVKNKRRGFKVVRKGNQVKFVRMTQQEKRARKKAAKKAWRVGKSSRKNKAKRTMIRSKVRMRSLYGK